MRCPWTNIGFCLLASAPSVRGQAEPFTLYQDFRGGNPPLVPLTLTGPTPDLYVKAEPLGFRITLPAGRERATPVGVALTAPVAGNFEVTTGFEILDAAKPKSGSGTGFELYVRAANAAQDAVAFYRMYRPAKEGEVYLCSRMTTKDGKRRFSDVTFAAANASGRLRLVRVGSEIAFGAADSVDGAFRELHRYAFVSDDVNLIKAAAYTGSDPVAVDLRILDLRIRGGITEPKTAEAPMPAPRQQSPAEPVKETPPVADSSLPSLEVIALAGTFVAVLGAAVWLFLRRRRDQPAESETSTPVAAIVVKCSECRKQFRVKGSLRGRRVKCGQCGAAILVPGGGDSTSASL